MTFLPVASSMAFSSTSSCCPRCVTLLTSPCGDELQERSRSARAAVRDRVVVRGREDEHVEQRRGADDEHQGDDAVAKKSTVQRGKASG